MTKACGWAVAAVLAVGVGDYQASGQARARSHMAEPVRAFRKVVKSKDPPTTAVNESSKAVNAKARKKMITTIPMISRLFIYFPDV